MDESIEGTRSMVSKMADAAAMAVLSALNDSGARENAPMTIARIVVRMSPTSRSPASSNLPPTARISEDGG